MSSRTFLHLSRAAMMAGLFIPLSHASVFGGKDKDASVKVIRGGPLKGKTTVAIGAFRVAFVTEDAANSVSRGAFSNGGSAARMTGELAGVDHALMQKITDAVYADFLKQAAAKGYTVIESDKLAKTASAYGELPAAENFVEGRLGTFVIPTGQRSVEMPADTSAKQEKGAVGFGAAFHNIGKNLAKSDANKVFPAAAKQVDAPVIGVTIVVNFANFKGTTSSFGSSKASIVPGATIDGGTKADAASATSILGWDGKTGDCAQCEAQFVLEGQIHSDAPIGASTTKSAMKAGDKAANAIGALYGTGQTNKKATVVEVDPEAYRTNVLLVAAEANEMLLKAMAGER